MPKSQPPEVLAAFRKFHENLLLDRGETENARKRHREVTAALEASGLFASTFLQGSFARKTMLAPLKDVDMVAVLWPAASGQERRPVDVMADARRAIAAAFPSARFDVEDKPAKALQVVFPDVTFHVDVVVAYPVDDDWVLIGNREEGVWQRSASRRLLRVVRERNQACDGRFVHQVRMLKAIKDASRVFSVVADGKAVSGLLMETLAYAAVTQPMPHPVAILRTLEIAPTLVTGILFDPASESDLTKDWSPSERVAVRDEFVRLGHIARAATVAADAGDADEALRCWAEICGDCFPKAPQMTERDAQSALWVGGVTPSGRITTQPRADAVSAPPVRAWRQS